ncbi:MAG: protease inhibitor I42 family protein [Phycisphaerales bacterium]|nr:protease inhibitor I42 family protein [Phycisphaerales bacterium]
MRNPFGCIGVLVVLVLAIGMGLGLQACEAGNRTSRSSNENEVIAGLAQAGSAIELRVGQILLVELPESPTPGRVWQMLRRPDGAVLMPDGNRYEQTPEQEARQDLVGMQQLRFEAVAPGETLLSLALVRPGTGLSSSDERWMGQIIVRQ